MRPRPLLAVVDVERASRWYQQVLGGVSGHGGAEYDRVLVEDTIVLQLHRFDVGHHHGTIGDPKRPLGKLRDPDGYLVVLAEAPGQGNMTTDHD